MTTGNTEGPKRLNKVFHSTRWKTGLVTIIFISVENPLKLYMSRPGLLPESLTSTANNNKLSLSFLNISCVYWYGSCYLNCSITAHSVNFTMLKNCASLTDWLAAEIDCHIRKSVFCFRRIRILPLPSIKCTSGFYIQTFIRMPYTLMKEKWNMVSLSCRLHTMLISGR